MNDIATNGSPASKLLRRARFLEERRRLVQLRDRLAACPRWGNAADLIAGIEETLRDIDALEERLSSKAVVAVVGGTGTGKSSLVNALCGRADAVQSGVRRPTTRTASAVVRSVGDADILLRHFDRGDLEVVPMPDTALPNAVLVDTPDTDSVECSTYSGVLDRVLENADVLVCVFDAANPKRKDNLDRLAHFVSKFQGRDIVLVLNLADRIPAGSLERDVVPDFRDALAKSWPGAKAAKLFCTVSLPGEASGSKNELHALLRFLQETAGTALLDERVARAGFLRASAEEGIRDVVRRQGDWEGLAGEVRAVEADIAGQMAVRFPATGGGDGEEDDMTALLRAVAARWWGPVGLFLGFSRRFRRLVQTPFRLSDLVLPLGILRRIRAFAGDGPEAAEAREKEDDIVTWDGLPETARLAYASLVERMVGDFGMDPALRDEKAAFAFGELSAVFRRSWRAAYEEEVRGAAKRCSGVFFQLLLNACSIVPAGYILWVVASTFLRGVYLPGAFYRQGLFLLGLAWLLASWIAQLRMNAEARAIPRRTAERFARGTHTARILPVAAEIDRLAGLAKEQSEAVP